MTYHNIFRNTMSTFTDNLYILDEEKDQNSIRILEFFKDHIIDINKITKRYLRIYSITLKMLEDNNMQEALKQRNIQRLPTLVVFNPRSETLVGTDEIILFYITLLQETKKIQHMVYNKKLQAAQDSKVDEYGQEPALLDDTQSILNNFYGNEIMAGTQEENLSTNINDKMKDRHRQQLAQRESGQPGRSSGGGIMDNDEDPIDLNKALQNRRRGINGAAAQTSPDDMVTGEIDDPKDTVMSSVKKVCGNGKSIDDNLEYQFFQNMIEDSTKM